MAVNYQVKQGDCIYSIAFEHGFFADTIWNHPTNAELKEKRGDPSVLMPGDQVFIPEKQLKEVSEPTNQVYKFRCKNTPKTLRIQFKYFETPIRDMAYRLVIDGNEKKGKTDNEGWLTCSISPDAKKAKVYLDDGTEYELPLGYLNPIDEMTGIQGRLFHLGLFEGKIDGVYNDETKQALKVFQISQNLEPSGELDETTKNLLKKLTGQ